MSSSPFSGWTWWPMTHDMQDVWQVNDLHPKTTNHQKLYYTSLSSSNVRYRTLNFVGGVMFLFFLRSNVFLIFFAPGSSGRWCLCEGPHDHDRQRRPWSSTSHGGAEISKSDMKSHLIIRQETRGGGRKSRGWWGVTFMSKYYWATRLSRRRILQPSMEWSTGQFGTLTQFKIARSDVKEKSFQTIGFTHS